MRRHHDGRDADSQELADTAAPTLADSVVVDLLETTVRGEEPAPGPVANNVLFRRVAIRSAELGPELAAPHPLR